MSETSVKLMLVDAMGLAYRSFFAVQGLSTSGGTPTNAVYGFVKTLLHLEKIWAPTHWAVVFDGGPAAARIAVFKDYKAQRPPMPDRLREQLPLIKEFLDKALIPRTVVERIEADDVMASIAARLQGEEPEAEGLLYTGDKDLFQMVNEKLAIVNPQNPERVMGPDEVRAKMGVPPRLVVAFLSLTGDAADNIPGVPGVGAKTAAKLLARYGSLDGLWAGLAEIEPGKLRAALSESRETVERNSALIRLDTNVACPFDWRTAVRTKPAPEELLPFFERLEFKSLVKTFAAPELL